MQDLNYGEKTFGSFLILMKWIIYKRLWANYEQRKPLEPHCGATWYPCFLTLGHRMGTAYGMEVIYGE